MRRYYESVNDGFLGFRGDDRFTWSVSHRTYMRSISSPRPADELVHRDRLRARRGRAGSSAPHGGPPRDRNDDHTREVDGLREAFDDVRVLRGSDAGAVSQAVAGVAGVAVTADPAAARAMSREDREASYRDVLVGTVESVVAAGRSGHLVMLSSLTVYGEAADHLDVVDEDAPVTDSDDPSPANFLAAERVYLDGAGDRSCILRCADIYGAHDPPIETKVGMAHELLGGSVPFRGDAPFYRVHVLDVVAAVMFALERELTGVYNLTHAHVPTTNRELLDSIGADLGFGPLEFRDEIAAPIRPISTERLRDAGFELEHTDAP